MGTVTATTLGHDQKRIVDVIQLSSFLDALAAIESDPKAHQAASEDVRQYLASRQVPLERDLNVAFSQKVRANKSGWSLCVGIGVISVCYQF